MLKKSLYLASAFALTAVSCQRKPVCEIDDHKTIKETWQALYDAREKTAIGWRDNSDSLEYRAFNKTIDSAFQVDHQVHIDPLWNNLYYTDDMGEKQKIDYQKPPYND